MCSERMCLRLCGLAAVVATIFLPAWANADFLYQQNFTANDGTVGVGAGGLYSPVAW